ncbi:MAG: DUF3467 domain-containing protein [Aggregatilineales bacterium]
MQDPQGTRRLRLEIPANLSAAYANGVIISQNTGEILLDFVQVLPHDPRARAQARVVLTPVSAKALLRALAQNLELYEQKHGEIQLPPQPASLADQLFGSVKPDGDKEAKEGHDE